MQSALPGAGHKAMLLAAVAQRFPDLLSLAPNINYSPSIVRVRNLQSDFKSLVDKSVRSSS